jgi:hypothetical protein
MKWVTVAHLIANLLNRLLKMSFLSYSPATCHLIKVAYREISQEQDIFGRNWESKFYYFAV